MTKLWSAGLVSLAVVSGCAQEREWHEPEVPFAPEQDALPTEDGDEWEGCIDCGAINPTIAVRDGHVGGDIGSFAELDLRIDQPMVYEDPSWGYTNINLTGYRDDGDMGMIFVDLMNVTVGEMPEGSSACGYDESSGVQISVTGCASGDQDSEYYDAPATSCEVVVQHTPEGSDVTVLATLPSFDEYGAQDGETHATAHFFVVPLE